MNPNDSRLVAARKKMMAGTMTKDEFREVFALMREDREAAHIISAKAKAAKAKPVINVDALLGELFP